MEMFVQNQVAPNDPRRKRVYENYQRNLEGMLEAAAASGAKVVLSTVAVNLKDCPPFGTASDAELSATNRAAFEKFCQDGAAAETQGNFAEARSDYQQGAEIFPQSAEAQFQLAKCLLRQTNGPAARRHFAQAVDDDTLAFRADSQINNHVREFSKKFAGDSLVLCEAAESLAAASPEGILGEEFLYEHVHFNPNGNFALAVAWAGEVEKFLKPVLKRGARPAWTSQAECEKLLGLTDWNRVSIMEDIVRRVHQPPFSSQSGNARQTERLQGKIDALRKNFTNETARSQAREIYLEALRRAPENFRPHENYAEFLEATHDLKSAIAERKKTCELIPQYYFAYYSLGVDLKEAGALAEAREALLKANALKSDQGDVRMELGAVLARQGEWELARQQLEAARQFSPDDPQPLLYLGEVLWKLDRRNEALEALRNAIRLAPSDWQPHYRLASDLAQQEDFSDAIVEYQEVLRLNPANVKAKLGMAAALANLGRTTEALQQLDEILTLEPNNRPAFEMRDKFRRR
jgi:tetratricopeptide (TPR) repeat protein